MGCLNNKQKAIHPLIQCVQQVHPTPALFVSNKGTKFLSKYERYNEIGKGSFSSVYKAIDKQSGKIRAVKRISKDVLAAYQLTEKDKLYEIDSLIVLDHPNIVKVYETFEEVNDFYVVMEYASGGTLLNKMLKHSFTEKEAAIVMYQLFSAVTYCHQKGLVHQDIKPDNIFLEDSQDEVNIKLSNIGNAALFDPKKRLSGELGPVTHIAPEAFSGTVDSKFDVWSCGVILYTLLAGKPPFNEKNISETVSEIQTKELVFDKTVNKRLSGEAKDLVSKLLERNHLRRLTALDAVNHPWIQKFKTLSNPKLAILKDVLLNLSSFNSEIKLRSAVFTYVVSNLLSQSDVKQLKVAFRVLDRNGDGIVTKEELLEVYQELFRSDDPLRDVEGIMYHVDTNGNGYIGYTEFVQAAINQNVLFTKKNLEQAFRVFDKDNSGTISAGELRDILSGGKESLDAVWRTIIQEVDTNGDGVIDIKEFTDVVLNRT